VDDLGDGAYGTESPEQYRARLAHNYRTSLRCWWSRDFGWLSLLDPFTGQVIEVEQVNAPRWMVWRAMDEKARKKGRRQSTGTSSAWR
jgi:hypothetical protein